MRKAVYAAVLAIVSACVVSMPTDLYACGKSEHCGCPKEHAACEGGHHCGSLACGQKGVAEHKVTKGYACEGDVACCCNGKECLGDKECCAHAPCAKATEKKGHK